MELKICFLLLYFVLVSGDLENVKKEPGTVANETSLDIVTKPSIPVTVEPKRSQESSSDNRKLKKVEEKFGRKKSKKRSKARKAAMGDTVLKGINKFAFDFHKTFPKNGSLFYSPYSIASTLALVYAGAGGKTKEEIAAAFGWGTSPQLIVHKSLGKFLARVSNGKRSMKVASRIWVDNYDRVGRKFRKTITNYYGSKLGRLDYFADPEGSRDAINKWVKEKTAGKIADLIPSGGITQETRFVLTNAVHFKALWEHQFDPKRTTKQDFTTAANKKIKLDMMRGTFDVTLKSSDAFLGVELPYKGKEFSMLILLPKSTSLDVAERDLDSIALEKMKSYVTPVEVIIPKFKLTSSYEIVENLKLLNIKSMFGDKADFSGMLTEKSLPLFVTDAIHKTFFQINEKGTEAAAATAVFVGRSLTPVFRADQPFLFFIKDTKTNVILFAGRFSP